MDSQQLIMIYSLGFRICLFIMSAGFGFALFSFFKYKIPTVFSLMTGRSLKKEIEHMRSGGQMKDEEK